MIFLQEEVKAKVKTAIDASLTQQIALPFLQQDDLDEFQYADIRIKAHGQIIHKYGAFIIFLFFYLEKYTKNCN